MWVLNIRWNWRGSVRSQASASPGCLEGFCPHWPSSSLSARKRSLQVRQSTIGSLNPARCPDASQTRGCWMIAESSATIRSSPSSIARHHSALTLFFSSTP